MPTHAWLQREFSYGYDSGDVLSWIPGRIRFSEERKSGGSYRQVFNKAISHQVQDNSFKELPNEYFDLFWSFGVLCHNDSASIMEILHSARRTMKRGGVSIHQYGDWIKLEQFGWSRGGVPHAFKTQSDQNIWWPRNDQQAMTKLAVEAGWDVLCGDLDLLQRDSLIFLRNP